MLDRIRGPCSFYCLAVGIHYNDLIAFVAFGPQSLALTALIVGDDLICGRKDRLCRSVILLELNYLTSREILLEIKDHSNIGTTECVDRLIVVTYYTDIVVSLGKEHYRIILRLVRILILVDHDVAELISIELEDIGIALEELYHIDEDIVEIHRVILDELHVIALIDLGILLPCGIRSRELLILLGAYHMVLGIRDLVKEVPGLIHLL